MIALLCGAKIQTKILVSLAIIHTKVFVEIIANVDGQTTFSHRCDDTLISFSHPDSYNTNTIIIVSLVSPILLLSQSFPPPPLWKTDGVHAHY